MAFFRYRNKKWFEFFSLESIFAEKLSQKERAINLVTRREGADGADNGRIANFFK